jgi:hypothetical protein
VHVQRLATIAHGDGVCTTHIPRASGVPHVTPAGGSTPPAQPNNSSTPDAVPDVAPPPTHESPEPLGIPRERPFS